MDNTQRPRIKYLKLVNWPPSAAGGPSSGLLYKPLTYPRINSAPGCRSRLPNQSLNVLRNKPHKAHFCYRSCFFKQSDISE